MQDTSVALSVIEGLQDLKRGRFSTKSILDLANERIARGKVASQAMHRSRSRPNGASTKARPKR
jgi:hypothetical protein